MKTSDSDEIEKLHGLMKKGIITEKEFETKKKKILNENKLILNKS